MSINQLITWFMSWLGGKLSWNMTSLDNEIMPVVPPEPPKTPVSAPQAPNRVYDAAKASLGLKLTDNIDPENECAESVSNILIQAGYKNPKIPTVNGLIGWMLANNFKEQTTPALGCIITAHRADPSDPNYAHTGIVMQYGIASNDSRPQYVGQFRENYQDVAHWVSYYNSVKSITRYFLPC